jgi:hypothetical protein
MKIRALVLTSAAASAIALAAVVAPPVLQPGWFATQAATNASASISIATFYDRLSPHGDWVLYKDRYVWVPYHIEAGWRPYTVGHWVYAKRHGWLWVSDEPFGWAVYHYGRWGWATDIGWYWVPGTIWGPAWVAWRRTDRDVAWAPLYPDWDDDEDVTVFYSRAPVHYWQVVPVSFFLSVNIHEHIVRDRDHVRRVVRESDPVAVKIENNVVVNTAIDIDFIEKNTDKKVVVHDVAPAADPESAGKAEDGKVAIFAPEVKEDADAKPAKAREVEEVAKERSASVAEDPEAVEETAAPKEETAPEQAESEPGTADKAEEQPAK